MSDYKLDKLEAGDYRLDVPGDPRIWRVTKREGLGPSARGMFASFYWAPARWNGQMGTAPDFDDWSQWEFVGGRYDTRAEAIDKVLAQPQTITHEREGSS